MPYYAVYVKEVKKPVLINAKNAANARKQAKKMGLSPKKRKTIQFHSFTK